MKELKENLFSARTLNDNVVKPWFRKAKRQLDEVRDRYPRQSIIAAVVAVVMVFSTTIYLHTNKSAYAVMINGTEAGLVSSESVAEEAVEGLIAKKSQALGGQEVKVADQITYERAYGERIDLLTKGQLEKVLEEKVKLVTTGAAVVINGQKRFTVANAAIGEQLLNQVKDYYAAKIVEGQEQVLSVAIEEPVEFQPETVALNEITSLDQAVQLLVSGADQTTKYKVKSGDSLWTIARANGLLVSDLINANPNLSNILGIDQEINLVKVEPLLTVVTTVHGQGTEAIAYQTRVQQDPNQWRGNETVKQAGVEGSRDIVYEVVKRNGQAVDRQILEETITKEPVDKIVIRGSKAMVASRGDGGNGQLAWPIRGTITSRYGYRGKEFHPALDIDGDTGDPVGAAEAGTVTFAGWDGNYGRMLEISHGGGLTTRYAHCSALLVNKGDKVTRGQTIAKVGSTGRSTGSHLHFEVRVYGVPRNPTGYLSK